jgi:arginase family enzyme
MPSKNLLILINVKLHLELALATEKIVDLGDDSNESTREENEEDQSNEHHNDIYNDINYFIFLNGGRMSNECVSQESNIIKKWIFDYY